jgi:hypothetical protein
MVYDAEQKNVKKLSFFFGMLLERDGGAIMMSKYIYLSVYICTV